MNLVIIKHPNDSGKYMFKVPEGVTLDAGQLVLVDTARGMNPGICATSSFEADPDVVAPMWGASGKTIKRVVKVLREFVLEWPEPEKEEPDDD